MNPYQLTEKEKQDLVKRLTQDVAWSQDEIYDVEQEAHTNVSEEDEEGLF